MEGIGRKRRGCSHFLGGQDSLGLAHPAKLRKIPWWAGPPEFRLLLLRNLLGTFVLHPRTPTPSPHPQLAPRPLIPGRSESGLGKRRQICAVPREHPQPTGGKGKMSISRGELPNSASHLLRHLHHHGDQLATLYPIRACLTQTSVEPGVPKTSIGLWEQDLCCPPSPTHSEGSIPCTAFPQTAPCGM